MGKIDRDEIREMIGNGPLAVHAMDTAEPFFQALENGFALTPKNDVDLAKVRKALGALRDTPTQLLQTVEDIARSRNYAINAALDGLDLMAIGMTDIEVSGIFEEPIVEAIHGLILERLNERLCELLCGGLNDLLVEYFCAVEEGEESRVRMLSPLIVLLPEALPTPFGTRDMQAFLVG